jgi:small-conductance mechanosensitive channel
MMEQFNLILLDVQSNPYLLGSSVAILSFVVLYFTRRLLLKLSSRYDIRTEHKFDDLVVYPLAHTTPLFMLVSALYIGFQFLPEYKIYPTWSWRIFFVCLMIQVGIWGSLAIKRWFQQSFSRRRKRDPASASSLSILELMLQVSFLTILLMFTLNNVGIQVTTMIAGLGVGGIAIALALQNILGDLFSSLSIILDKPFVVGDFIVMGEWLGEVEYIGLKTTRIRSLSGEQIIVSNSDLLSSRIRNMKRMSERRNVIVLSLSHDTTAEGLKKAVEIVTAVVCSKTRVRFDRCHFSKVCLHSLDVELVYFILHDDYNIHMDIQQSILMDVHQLFLMENLKFAQAQRVQTPLGPTVPVTFESATRSSPS